MPTPHAVRIRPPLGRSVHRMRTESALGLRQIQQDGRAKRRFIATRSGSITGTAAPIFLSITHGLDRHGG